MKIKDDRKSSSFASEGRCGVCESFEGQKSEEFSKNFPVRYVRSYTANRKFRCPGYTALYILFHRVMKHALWQHISVSVRREKYSKLRPRPEDGRCELRERGIGEGDKAIYTRRA